MGTTLDRIGEVATRAGLSREEAIRTFEEAIATAAARAWGAGRTFEASYVAESGAVDLHHVLQVVDKVTDATSQVPIERVRELGFEPGDEMLVQVFYRDEDAEAARATCADTPEVPSFDAIGEGLPLPDEPPWLRAIWPVRRLRWRWGARVEMPRVPQALDRIDRWLAENAPESVLDSFTPAPIEELELLGALGRGASELAALHARIGGACGTLEIFGAALIAPSRAERLAEILTRLAADPSFGRWDPAWFPFLSWEAETYAIDFREGAGMRVLHWESDTRALTLDAPSLAAWLGLLAAAADAGVLEWRNGIARDLVLYRELQAALMPSYPRALET